MQSGYPTRLLILCIRMCLLSMTFDEGLALMEREDVADIIRDIRREHRGSAIGDKVEDYPDDSEDGTYEQQSEADIFYEDAVRLALRLLWTQRFHISRANFYLIDILGRNAAETIKYGGQLRAVRDVIDRRSEQLREKTGQRLTLSEMKSEPIIGQETLDELIRTWKRVTKVFDLHPPRTSTLEFSTTYRWMQNIENNTYEDYRKVNWFVNKIRKMCPIKQR